MRLGEGLGDGPHLVLIGRVGLDPQDAAADDLDLGAGLAEGLEHVMGLVTAPDLEPGAFYVEGEPVQPRDPQPLDAQARIRLLELSEASTGVPVE